MADAFIGLQMLVTVRGAQLKGTVSSVEAGTSLTLSNVWRLDTNQWEPRITIQASDILDLCEIPAAPVVDVPAVVGVPNPLAAIPPQPEPAPVLAPAFADPAIVAVGKRPKPAAPSLQIEAHPHPNIGEKRDPQPVTGSSPAPQSASQDATPTASIAASMEGLSIKVARTAVDAPLRGEEEVVELRISGQPSQEPRRRTRRGNRRARNGVQDDVEASPQPAKSRPSGQGEGWRQTPMLQSTPSFQPYSSLKKNGAKGKAVNDNGWASEDVTDVQEAGDFDFEGGLAKFDKRNLFEQMRKEDTIDEAERLVSHNRQQRPKPGTAGGKNFHHSENVLDAHPAASRVAKEKPSKETPNDFWNSEADEGILNGAERLSGRDMGSRQSSRRGESKMSTSRRSQSRKASAATSGQPTRVNSGVSTQPYTIRISRPSSRLSITVIDKKKQLAGSNSHRGLYLLPSNRKLETVSALQMLNLENIAHNELGLTEDMMTENAGRGVAEVTLAALNDPAIKVRQAATADQSSGTNPTPTVVILAGNNKSGIRAVAAGRHLRNKNVNVLVCVVGIERERELLEDMRQQVRLFRGFGGQLFSKRDLFTHLRKASIPTLTIDTPRTALSSMANPSPVTLIIDALLGLATSFEELRTGDQATVYELIEWANRNEAFVLAIDVPTGIDPTSGKVSVVDGNQLYVKPRYVVAMGAPKRGLLEAVVASEGDDAETVTGNVTLADDAATEWKLFVADIGLGAAVWKRAGTKIRRGIDFDDKWVLEMKYRGGPEQVGDMLA